MKYEHSGPYTSTRRHYCARIASYWLCITLSCALTPVPGYTQEEAEENAPPDIAEPAAVKPALSNLLALMPTATEVTISAGSSEFAAVLEPSRSGTAQGTLILVPGNGQKPGLEAPTTQLQKFLPNNSWQTLTISLHPWPGTRRWLLDEKNNGPTQEAETDPESAEKQPKTSTTDIIVPETPQQWQEANLARLAAAITYLRGNSNEDIFLAGDGLGALLVNTYLANTPGSGISGAVLIAPHRPLGAKPTLSTALDVPVLDLLPAQTRVIEARQRRLALSSGPGYQQLRLSLASLPRLHADSLLSRRIRGWMESFSG